MTVIDIISNVANDAGDPGFEILKKEEYLAILNETLTEISTKCNLSYQSKTYDLIENTSSLDITDKNISKLIRVVYQHEDINYALKEVTLNDIKNELNNPSITGITISNDTVFYDVNNNPVLEIEGNTHTAYNGKKLWYSYQAVNGLITLFFPWTFSADDKLIVHYYATLSVATAFDSTDIIWGYFATVLMEGMRWRVIRRLSFRKDVNDPKMWVYNKDWIAAQQLYYSKFLPELKLYSRTLGSVSSAKEMKPFNLFDPEYRF